MSAALGQVLLADGAALVESGALPADSLPAALIASIVEALKRLHAAVAEARSHREKLSSLLHVAVATAMELHGTLRAPAFPGVSALEEVLTELLAAYDMAATRARVYGQQSAIGKLLRRSHSVSRFKSSNSSLVAVGKRLRNIRERTDDMMRNSLDRLSFAGSLGNSLETESSLDGFDAGSIAGGMQGPAGGAAKPIKPQLQRSHSISEGVKLRRGQIRDKGKIKVRCVTCVSGQRVWWGAKDPAGRRTCLSVHDLTSGERTTIDESVGCGKVYAIAQARGRVWTGHEGGYLRAWSGSDSRALTGAFKACNTNVLSLAAPEARGGEVWCGSAHGNVRIVKLEGRHAGRYSHVFELVDALERLRKPGARPRGESGQPLDANLVNGLGKAHNDRVEALLVVDGCVWSAGGDGDCSIRVWDVVGRRQLFELPCGELGAAKALALAHPTASRRASLLSITAGGSLPESGSDDAVSAHAALDLVVSCHAMGALMAWAASSAERLFVVQPPAGGSPARSLCSCRGLIAVGHDDGHLRVWDVWTPSAPTLAADVPAHDSSILCVCRAGAGIMTSTKFGDIRFWSLKTIHDVSEARFLDGTGGHGADTNANGGGGGDGAHRDGDSGSAHGVSGALPSPTNSTSNMDAKSRAQVLVSPILPAADANHVPVLRLVSPTSTASRESGRSDASGDEGAAGGTGRARAAQSSQPSSAGRAKVGGFKLVLERSTSELGARGNRSNSLSSHGALIGAGGDEAGGTAATGGDLHPSQNVGQTLRGLSIEEQRATPSPPDLTEMHTAVSANASGLSRQSTSTELDMLATFELDWSELDLSTLIGEGSYGKVYRASWRSTEVAVKVLSGTVVGDEVDVLDNFRREACLLRRLRHPNVVLLMGVVSNPPQLAIVTEYLHRGSLFDVIGRARDKGPGSLPWARKLQMAIDVAVGMAFLHSNEPPVLHRDLKSSNLLVDRNMNVKICDLGLGRMMEGTMITASRTGVNSPRWMSPEYLRGEPTTGAMDTYSFGVVLWELLTLQVPWAEFSNTWQVRTDARTARSLVPHAAIYANKLCARARAECWSYCSLVPVRAARLARAHILVLCVSPECAGRNWYTCI